MAGSLRAGAVVEPLCLAADPGSAPGNGGTYFNTTRRVFRTYDTAAGAWVDLPAAAAKSYATRTFARAAFR